MLRLAGQRQEDILFMAQSQAKGAVNGVKAIEAG